MVRAQHVNAAGLKEGSTSPMYLALFIWVILSLVALLLSVAVRHDLHRNLFEDRIANTFALWIASMLTLDAAIILAGIALGFNPPFSPCMMLLVIQSSYIASAVYVYIRFTMKDGQFHEGKEGKALQTATIGVISLNTVLLIWSLNIVHKPLTLWLSLNVIVLFLALLDHFLIRSGFARRFWKH